MPVHAFGQADDPVPATSSRATVEVGAGSATRIRGRPVPAAFPADGPVYAILAGEAPGPRGADRSGVPFVGDAAGRPVYRALAAAGMATFPDALAVALAAGGPAWDGARIAEVGSVPVLRGVALTNSFACCPTDDGVRFRAPRRRDEVLAPWNVARLAGELAEARDRGLRVVVALGRAADWAFGTHLGLRADPGVRYVAVPHPSTQGLLSAAPDRGRGARLEDLAADWQDQLAQILTAAWP